LDRDSNSEFEASSAESAAAAEQQQRLQAASAAELWSKPTELEEDKSRDDEFDEFLEDLFM